MVWQTVVRPRRGDKVPLLSGSTASDDELTEDGNGGAPARELSPITRASTLAAASPKDQTTGEDHLPTARLSRRGKAVGESEEDLDERDDSGKAVVEEDEAVGPLSIV